MTNAAQGVQYGYAIPKRFGKVEITKETEWGTVEVYLRRWYLWRTKSGASIRLHHICLPDQDQDPHDHPWWFLSIVLFGGYDERWIRHLPGAKGGWRLYFRKVRRFSFHRATDGHKITHLRRPKRGAWTIIITGRERNQWGFLTPTGKVPWREYAAQGRTRGPGTDGG